MYIVIFATRAMKNLKRYQLGGSLPKKKLEIALAHLREQRIPPVPYRDHQLGGQLSNYREFHLAGDLLVQYELDDESKLITITKVGTHAELFGE
ncbi:MAG: type II toxin-antitoxin system YafQ family toxin [bacterium]|nr:type II toxin-antitoxin system YafQ family toxin [bacterium]